MRAALEIIIPDIFERFVLDRLLSVLEEHRSRDFLLDLRFDRNVLIDNWFHFVLKKAEMTFLSLVDMKNLKPTKLLMDPSLVESEKRPIELSSLLMKSSW